MRRRIVLLGWVCGLLVGSPRAVEATVQSGVVDTVPAAKPRLFERRVLFSGNYLSRIFAAAQRSAAAAKARSTQAAVYAERYGIDQELAEAIVHSAVAEGLDPELGFRMVRVESVFRIDARGRSGSLGLTQLMPSTARAIDRSLRTEAQILDPTTNLRIGFRYLRNLIDRYDDVRLGLLAYNRGEGTVDRALRNGVDPENGYSPRVLELGGEEYTGDGFLKEEVDPKTLKVE